MLSWQNWPRNCLNRALPVENVLTNTQNIKTCHFKKRKNTFVIRGLHNASHNIKTLHECIMAITKPLGSLRNNETVYLKHHVSDLCCTNLQIMVYVFEMLLSSVQTYTYIYQCCMEHWFRKYVEILFHININKAQYSIMLQCTNHVAGL